MTVSYGIEGQLKSEARICIYNDIKALRHDFVILIFSTCEFVIEDSAVQRDLPKILLLFHEMDF